MPFDDATIEKFALSARGIVPLRVPGQDWPVWVVPSEVEAILTPQESGCVVAMRSGRTIACTEAACVVAATLFPAS